MGNKLFQQTIYSECPEKFVIRVEIMISDTTCLACGKSGHSWNKCWDHAKKTLFVRRNPNIVAGCQKINILLTKINVPKNEELLGGV